MQDSMHGPGGLAVASRCRGQLMAGRAHGKASRRKARRRRQCKCRMGNGDEAAKTMRGLLRVVVASSDGSATVGTAC